MVTLPLKTEFSIVLGIFEFSEKVFSGITILELILGFCFAKYKQPSLSIDCSWFGSRNIFENFSESKFWKESPYSPYSILSLPKDTNASLWYESDE